MCTRIGEREDGGRHVSLSSEILNQLGKVLGKDSIEIREEGDLCLRIQWERGQQKGPADLTHGCMGLKLKPFSNSDHQLLPTPLA